MTTPDPNFTANPQRAIYIQGTIDQDLIYRVTPKILALQSEGRDPITVYIDSRGGAIEHKNTLLRLLRASTQNCEGPCNVITVALSLAASAAADLLASGYYALAYPETLIMYHGVRTAPPSPQTAEQTYRLAQDLREGNESYAVQLARDTEERFFFRFMSLYDLLDAARGDTVTGGQSDLEAFVTLLAKRTSPSANVVLRSAYERNRRYAELIGCVVKQWAKGKGKSFVQLEASQIKAIVDFEVRANKKNEQWAFETEGIHTLSDDFFLVNQFLKFFEGKVFERLALRWGRFLLSTAETADLDAAPQQERDKKLLDIVGPRLRPIFSFFMALCHILQEGDNYLTARDAFWLGLIDEVIGVKELPTYRVFVEHGQEVEKESEQAPEAAEASAGA